MKEALVTGASGFVGRRVYKALSRAGYTVIGVDIATPMETDVLTFFERDLGDDPFDVVFHCAAFVNGRAGIDGSPAYLHAYNTQLDAAMFTWALRSKPGRVVYFSSSAAYPAKFQSQHFEDHGWRLEEDDIHLDFPSPPEATYGLSKLHGEQMARSVREAGVPVTVLRPFSGYGADQDCHYPFPAFMRRAREKADPFEVWGDGTQIRDWIHIDDLVGAAMAAVENDVDGPVNICTGIGTSFTDLAKMAMKFASYEGEIRYRKDRPAGVQYRVGDPKKMSEFYTPRVHLEDAVRAAVATL